MNNTLCQPAAASAIGESFDDVVLPHLDAAYRLARWLTRNEEDAEDVVQEASLRALRYFRTFTGGNGRAWFLRIVRNTCAGRYAHVSRYRPIRSMKSDTAAPGQQPTPKRCCSIPMTSP